MFATHMSLRSSGQNEAASVVKDLSTSSPSRASKYKAGLRLAGKAAVTKLSGDSALSMLVEAKLTRSQYEVVRMTAKTHNTPIYPCYPKVLEAKTRCYPSNISVNETIAEVKLQPLLDHTCTRILRVQNDVIDMLDQTDVRHLKLILKWGMDGSSDQSEYKQKFANEDSSDASIFLTSLVPLQLITIDNEKRREIIIWKNFRPSSTRFCRPIKMQFLHEDVRQLTKRATSLVPLDILIAGKKLTIHYEMLLTMIDGKVCNSITSTTSTMRCYLCGATSKEFNDIKRMHQKKVEESRLSFGLSTLHARINFFECLLHLGYELGIRKWQARSLEDKSNIRERKTCIQKAQNPDLGTQTMETLLVDFFKMDIHLPRSWEWTSI